VEAYVTGGGYVEVSGSLADGDLSIEAFNLNQGVHEITYVARDECRNVSLCQYQLNVIDEVAPVLICQDSINISLTGMSGVDPDTKLFVDDLEVGSAAGRDCNPTILRALRSANFTAGQVILSDGSYLQVNDRYGYHYVSGCEPDGEIRDTAFTKDGAIDSVNIIPYVLEEDFVKFCCSDVGTVEVTIIGRDVFDNVNHCEVSVNVENQLGITLVCEDYMIACADEIEDDRRPSVSGLDCQTGAYTLVFVDSDLNSISGCAKGEVIRTWYIDRNENGELNTAETSCEQTISFDDSLSTFDPMTIKWPVHRSDGVSSGITLECNSVGDVTEWPTPDIALGGSVSCGEDYQEYAPVWCKQTCGLVGSSFKIDTIVTNEACLRLVKQWTVIDWCTYQPNENNEAATDDVTLIYDDMGSGCSDCPERNGALAEYKTYYRYTSELNIDGYYRFDQYIEIRDDNAAVITAPDSLTLLVEDVTCEAVANVAASAQDFCNGSESDSNTLQWRAILINEQGSIIFDKSDFGADVNMDITGSSGETLQLRWEVTDACGNISNTMTVIYVRDNLAPSIICISSVSVALNAEGGTAIWAKDFNASSFDNCTAASDLIYTIVPEGQEPIRPGREGFREQSNAVIDCAALQEFATISYDVWAWDESQNGNSCRVVIQSSELCDLII